MLKFSLNAICQDRNATLMMLNIEKDTSKDSLLVPSYTQTAKNFCITKTACSMIWHEVGRTKDGLLRHPADSFAWKDFDHQYPDFACDARNVRLWFGY